MSHYIRAIFMWAATAPLPHPEKGDCNEAWVSSLNDREVKGDIYTSRKKSYTIVAW